MSTMRQDTTPVRRPRDPGPWTVVLPVKGGPSAKTRLGHPARAHLARAFALDAVAAVLACPAVAQVLVVTADDALADAHEALGARIVPDPGGGLHAALGAGRHAADPQAPCALLLADLPCLRADDLDRALTACTDLLAAGATQVTVPDADGGGTVLLAAATPTALRPAFGDGSARAHGLTSHVLVDVPDGVRRDVDTEPHLEAALGLGVGPRTAAVLAAAP